jgi:DnaK suppressor protein
VSNLEAIKERLLKRKQELEQVLAQIYREQVTDTAVPDTGDQAFSSTIEDLRISLHNNELEEYTMIMKALERIEHGTYGICAECGNPVSEKRLLLFPNATRCLGCQEALEEGKP